MNSRATQQQNYFSESLRLSGRSSWNNDAIDSLGLSHFMTIVRTKNLILKEGVAFNVLTFLRVMVTLGFYCLSALS